MKHTDYLSKIILLIFCCIFLFCGCAFGPSKYIDTSLLPTEERVTLNQKVFDKVWNLVNEKYYDPTFNGKDWVALGDKYRGEALAADNNKILYDTINKMLGELDSPHLESIMTARFEDIFSSFNEPVAAGFTYQIYEGKVVVSSIFQGSLAERAGVQKGWLIKKMKGLSPLDNKTDIKTGEESRKIPIIDVGKSESYLFLDQDNQEHSITLTPSKEDENFNRWLINFFSKKYEPVIMSELPGGILYLHIKNFISRNVIKSITSKLNDYNNAPGVILDLRYNPGGKMYNLYRVLNIFFQDDVYGGTIIRRSGKIREFKIRGERSGYVKPIVILTNIRTECAAEMFTHVLQHYKRATVIGRQTRGDVQGARSYFLSGGGLLSIPVRVYIGLDGVQIHRRGVTPDVVVPAPTLATIQAGRDLDIEAALQVLNEKKTEVEKQTFIRLNQNE